MFSKQSLVSCLAKPSWMGHQRRSSPGSHKAAPPGQNFPADIQILPVNKAGWHQPFLFPRRIQLPSLHKGSRMGSSTSSASLPHHGQQFLQPQEFSFLLAGVARCTSPLCQIQYSVMPSRAQGMAYTPAAWHWPQRVFLEMGYLTIFCLKVTAFSLKHFSSTAPEFHVFLKIYFPFILSFLCSALKLILWDCNLEVLSLTYNEPDFYPSFKVTLSVPVYLQHPCGKQIFSLRVLFSSCPQCWNYFQG